jgi:hypothetical protein
MPNGSTTAYRWQNFALREIVAGYTFLPFGFSGVSVNRRGDNVDATLTFPNTAISRSWAIDAVSSNWIATVKVLSLSPTDINTYTLLHTYVGQMSSGAWDETTLNITLNSVLDAVGSVVPTRKLTKSLLGAIPTTSNVRLS